MFISRSVVEHEYLKVNIPKRTRLIVMCGETVAPHTNSEYQQITNLFNSALGLTEKERKKYAFRYRVGFGKPKTEFFVEFYDSTCNGEKASFPYAYVE